MRCKEVDMKPLLTILLIALSFGVKGQEWNYRFENAPNIDYMESPYISPSYSKITLYDPIVITLDMIFDYVQECYEDSVCWVAGYKYRSILTPESITVLPNIDNGRGELAPGYWRYIGEYIECTPATPTFEGFAEYLKRKYVKE